MIEKIRDKIDVFMKNLTIFLLILLSYVFVPQLVGSLLYYKVGISENISLLIGSFVYLLGLFIIFRKMFIEKIKDFLNKFGNYFGKSLKYWGIGLIVMFISNLILAYIVFPGEIATNEELNREFIGSNLFVGFLSVVLLGPIIEEMVFRFGIRIVTGKNKFYPLISALCFGLPHALTGITSPLELLYVIPYGALGYAFAYIYNDTDNIFCSTSMHILHNLICFVIIASL